MRTCIRLAAAMMSFMCVHFLNEPAYFLLHDAGASFPLQHQEATSPKSHQLHQYRLSAWKR